MKIEVILQNLTPFHSSVPGDSRVDLQGRWASEGFPCIRTRTMRFARIGADNDEDIPTVGTVPIVPANTLRHTLRSRMLNHVLDQIRGKATLSIGAYTALSSGSTSGNPDGVKATFAELKTTAQHPFLGLWGGGPRMMEGKIKVDSAYAITQDYLPLLGPYEELATNSKTRLLEVVFTRRVDPVLGQQLDQELIDGGAAAITQYSNQQADIRRNKKPKGSEAVADEDKQARGLNSFTAHEHVIPGVNWLWRISARNPTNAQRGMILNALQELHGEQVGGMSRLEYGRFHIKSILVDGKPAWNGHALDSTNEQVATWLSSLADSLDEIEAGTIEAFAKSEKSPKTASEG
ncbi:TPA: type IV CRISPR-associated protein Csf2 [Pseudomonas aeruginosa]|uniref:type IV CRISPR-associated protein Csf2 n=1 Tax=Pseudomonas aeruginosa TaxID=287 RepID=UPI0009A9E689|nr:type IV CRISPR-associated protein Csf2 [Pseudomonas aeruginosa]ELP9629056.1 type IV CRISPR-associated protein Csf2 [Pseudomonas aeruginosa]ELQ6364647.1 type IV CRISPR-associated protein Csf2 [Pseudomonas aeruginosa]MBG3954198.1 type IV CRISPR-associated protein Csf2 [Pseudomonas aeruginosa]HCR1319792.1 type IV CRISPR-associated protein Csf2 [Pseudomonas aeruginosa]HCR1374044.1 type IV CRISPR-associated protein Csf2 [Pseudomonas aeruginosa]